jgi:guanylate kinase
LILVISGPGGVGKGTVVGRLLAADPRLWLSRSWTTRPRRQGEDDGAYEFVDREAFQARVEAGGFVEHTFFPGTGHLYGTPTLDVPEGKDAVLEIDVEGARQVKARYPDAVVVFIVAPSPASQEARLRARGDDEEHIRRRLEVGAREQVLGVELADAIVVNEDVEQAAAEVAGILERHRQK